MTDLPDPMTPPECDLQDFPFMPLHVARLRDSDLAGEASPEACWYAVLLWAASWHQLPAGSLPDSEAILTKLLGLGRDVRTFRKHRAEAMRGFVLCSDGRLYHPVVAEQAMTAWNGKLQQRWRTECARIKKHNQRTGEMISTPTFEEFMRGLDGSVPDPGPGSVPRDTEQSPSGQSLQEKEKGKGTIEEEAIASLSSTDDVKAKRKTVTYPVEFDLAWKAYPHVQGRSSKPNALVQWKALSPEERAGLVEGIGRFRPNVAKACGDRGAPCMARWLRDGKHLDWLSASPGAAPVAIFDGPPALRSEVVDLLGEGFAANYIDPSRWLPGGRVLLADNAYAAKRIRKDLAEWLVSRNVSVEVAGALALVAAEA